MFRKTPKKIVRFIPFFITILLLPHCMHRQLTESSQLAAINIDLPFAYNRVRSTITIKPVLQKDIAAGLKTQTMSILDAQEKSLTPSTYQFSLEIYKDGKLYARSGDQDCLPKTQKITAGNNNLKLAVCTGLGDTFKSDGSEGNLNIEVEVVDKSSASEEVLKLTPSKIAELIRESGLKEFKKDRPVFLEGIFGFGRVTPTSGTQDLEVSSGQADPKPTKIRIYVSAMDGVEMSQYSRGLVKKISVPAKIYLTSLNVDANSLELMVNQTGEIIVLEK